MKRAQQVSFYWHFIVFNVYNVTFKNGNSNDDLYVFDDFVCCTLVNLRTNQNLSLYL